MKLLTLFALLIAPAAAAVNLSEAVNASQLKTQTGTLIASGTMCWLGTDSSNSPVSYTPQGGSAISTAVCGAVTSGIVSGLNIANPAFVSPAGLNYRVTIQNNGLTVLTIPNVVLNNAPIVFWDMYATSGAATGLGAPTLPCIAGASYTQTDSLLSSPTWSCGAGNIWAPQGKPIPVITPTNRTVSVLNSISLGTKQAISGIAPTITQQTSDTITNSVLTSTCNATYGCPDNTHFRWEAGVYAKAGPTNPKAQGVSNVINAEALGGAPVTYETLVDAAQFEYVYTNNGQKLEIYLDGSVVVQAGPDTRTSNTAQAGSSNTITLDAGASATAGAYNTMYVFIISGTGAGESGQILSYVGTTKVATIVGTFATPPDNTSVFRVNVDPAAFAIDSTGSIRYLLFTFGGVRATRRLKVISSGYSYEFVTDSSGSISAPATQYSMVAFGVGDSFVEGTNAVVGYNDNFFAVLCNKLGWEPWNLGQGGTGVVNNDSSIRLPYAGRVLPPVNSWVINTNPLSAAGTFTLTQGPITMGSVATNASQATLQAALDTAFGSGIFYATVHPYYGYVIEATGASASINTPMTVTQTGGTGVMTIFPYLGDIAPYVPVDGSGNPKPFVIFIEGSGNDDNQAGVQAAAASLYSGVAAKWPQAIVIASGRWMNFGPAPTAGKATDVSYVAASPALPTINSHSAFIDLFNNSTGVGYLNCQTTIAGPTGASGCNTDYYVSWDGTHPSTAGYNFLSNQLLGPIINMFSN